MTMAKELISLRLDPDLHAWLKRYAADHDTAKNTVVEGLLEALRENRLQVTPRQGPTAFPAERSVQAGETPEFPIMIAPGTNSRLKEGP